MKIPKGYTEQQVLEIFERVVNKLAFKFRFGYMDVDDLKQEAAIMMMEAMERFDASRPLANFLYIHLRNRLYNFKRNRYIRIELPCSRCPLEAYLPPEGCSAYNDRMDCSLFEGWISRNTAKRNLNNTLEYNQVNAVSEKHMGYGDQIVENIHTEEILNKIDEELPISLRKTYLRMLANDKVNKKDRELVESEVLNIIKRNKLEL